jgi:hypothetical protein
VTSTRGVFAAAAGLGDEDSAITPTTPTFSTEVSVSGIYGVTGRATILDFSPALHAEQRVGGVVVVALRAQHRFLSRQFVKQRLGVFEVGSVETLGEPAVDFGEHRASFVSATLHREQAGEAHRGTQLPCFRTHLLRERD